MPRIVGRQQHQSNVEAATLKDYYKIALTIPLLDHFISELDTYFDPNNDAVMSSFLCVLPALLVSWKGNPVQAALQYYADDLPSPKVFDEELFRWWRKWLNADQALPSSAVQAFEECYHEFFPNVHKLLHILHTLPITSAGCDQPFGTFYQLKTYLRATMASERESGLALMNIHYSRQIDVGATIDIFARKYTQSLLLADILPEWTVNHKTTVFDEACNVFNY